MGNMFNLIIFGKMAEEDMGSLGEYTDPFSPHFCGSARQVQRRHVTRMEASAVKMLHGNDGCDHLSAVDLNASSAEGLGGGCRVSGRRTSSAPTATRPPSSPSGLTSRGQTLITLSSCKFERPARWQRLSRREGMSRRYSHVCTQRAR